MSKKTRSSATPAIALLDANNVPYRVHEYHHDTDSEVGFGLEGAAKLGVDPHRVFKTLMVMVDGVAWTVVVPASGMADLKAVASAAGGKRAEMMAPEAAERATGYVVGGISPLGQKRAHSTIIDDSALTHPTILVSGGRRGLSLEVAAADLARIAGARFAPIGRR